MIDTRARLFNGIFVGFDIMKRHPNLRKDNLMFLAPALLMLHLSPVSPTSAEAPKPAKGVKPASTSVTLDSFIGAALAKGFPDKFPGPLADLTGLPKEVPYYGLAISSAQANDGMFHGFRVIVEASGNAKPVELLLQSAYTWPGSKETYFYRASLTGKLQRAVLLNGKLDGEGKTLKGASTTMEKDINSPEIKERFQHELDLWLKKTYLKKEWRSAEFSAGALNKAAR